MTTSAARAESLTKVYGQGDTRVVALDDVTVQLAEGAFTAIMGPSGSGKSTLMHCMAGLDSVTSGTVWIGETSLSPYELLAAVKRIEADMGRAPSRRWGPRLIDVDILFLGDHTLDDRELTLPHKELFGRGFVLAPLVEIAPDLVLDGIPVKQALTAVDVAGVRPWDEG